jgi:hypothetical protein
VAARKTGFACPLSPSAVWNGPAVSGACALENAVIKPWKIRREDTFMTAILEEKETGVIDQYLGDASHPI